MTTRRPTIAKFTRREFEDRAERACRLMTGARLDGLLLTSESNLEYLSGFTTQFAWNSPTRPWYFLLPRVGPPLAVIPEIGESNWRATSWVANIQTWPSPRPKNEGLDLLRGAIGKMRRRYGRIGFELGPETRIGMPVADLLRLRRTIRRFTMVDGASVMRELRLVKSPAEVARIRQICQIVSDSFDALPGMVQPGDSERDVVGKFQADILLRGAEKTPYTAIGSGRGGYHSIIMGPTDRKLREGDVFLIDTGSRLGGYFCDFNRNIAIGPPTDAVKRAQDTLTLATDAGIRAIRPGNRASDLFAAQARVLEEAGYTIGNVGRFGHGLGKVMTEPPSNRADDPTELVPGMVLTIEPSLRFGRGKIHVHEENAVVTETGCRLLSRRAPRAMPIVRF